MGRIDMNQERHGLSIAPSLSALFSMAALLASLPALGSPAAVEPDMAASPAALGSPAAVEPDMAASLPVSGAEPAQELPPVSSPGPSTGESPDWESLRGREKLRAWRKAPVDPRYETDFSAYTVGRYRLRVGLLNMSFGLLDNLQVGTAPVLDLLGVVNLNGKVTAIQTRRVDVAFEASGMFLETATQQQDPINLTAWPLMATGSWIISERLSLHLGYRWDNLDIDGQFDSADLVAALADLVGLNLEDEILSGLGGEDALYGGGHITLGQGRLGMDWRLNRRDSLVLLIWRYNTISARIDAGIGTDSSSIGAAAHFSEPLESYVGATTTIAYQLTWPRLRIRVGLPISGSDTLPVLWIPQAFEIYMLL